MAPNSPRTALSKGRAEGSNGSSVRRSLHQGASVPAPASRFAPIEAQITPPVDICSPKLLERHRQRQSSRTSPLGILSQGVTEKSWLEWRVTRTPKRPPEGSLFIIVETAWFKASSKRFLWEMVSLIPARIPSSGTSSTTAGPLSPLLLQAPWTPHGVHQAPRESRECFAVAGCTIRQYRPSAPACLSLLLKVPRRHLDRLAQPQSRESTPSACVQDSRSCDQHYRYLGG